MLKSLFDVGRVPIRSVGGSSKVKNNLSAKHAGSRVTPVCCGALDGNLGAIEGNRAIQTVEPPTGVAVEKERIAKFLARAGVASRRDSERLIEAGRIALNGVIVRHPATLVSAADALAVDGRAIDAPQQTRIWCYHKPAGLVTTARDPQGRPTVFSGLPKTLPRVISVGRLDINTEGLLLLTNDGGLARHLEHPVQGVSRTYRIRVHGIVSEATLAELGQGVIIDGISYREFQVTLDHRQRSNSWLTMTLNEGKNREIKKLLEHIGLRVTRLIRISYGPFCLGKLEANAVAEVPVMSLPKLLPAYFSDAVR